MSATLRAPVSPAGPSGYPVDAGFYDEAFLASGEPRPHYAGVLDSLRAAGLDELRASVDAELAARGVAFGGGPSRSRFEVDPVPRIVSAAEWAHVRSGLEQRARALNAFLEDVYSTAEIVGAGVVPQRALRSCAGFEPALVGVPVPGGTRAHVCGMDLVRTPAGELMVLEDNVRTPSGLAFAVAARAALANRLPQPVGLAPLDTAFGLLGRALAGAAPRAGTEPSVALLSNGSVSGAWYEHRTIAAQLDIPIVQPRDLTLRSGALHARGRRGRRPIDVLYRRVDDERLTRPDGSPTPLGKLLLHPIRAGKLACVNAFGSGVADDKLMHAYVERMIGFYLDEAPLLRSVPTYDLGEPAQLRAALERLGELVTKPRWGLGGEGVTIGPRAGRATLERVRARLRRRPGDFVAQETVALSRHPTVRHGRLEPRHVDLRPFALATGEGVSVVPGGLTRFARRRGELVVNSSRGGGAKDTWVV